MRELTVLGLDVDGKHIICEALNSNGDSGDRFKLLVDDRLRAAVRGDGARLGQPGWTSRSATCSAPKRFSPGFARAHPSSRWPRRPAPRSPGSSGSPTRCCWNGPGRRAGNHGASRARRRSRGGDTAGDGQRRIGRAWARPRQHQLGRVAQRRRPLDGTAGLEAGRSDNVAHFRFSPGAHGGTVTAIDDAASELIDPDFDRPLRPVAAVAQLDFDDPAPPPETPAAPERQRQPARARRGKPPVPAWEDVLLGVRSGGNR
ncbi:hypothetical protein I552_1854 [Mycobacterium xenopi 3993]|nr:hypothetical protein I552_1854 [Mycobacterium xenopi 3993]